LEGAQGWEVVMAQLAIVAGVGPGMGLAIAKRFARANFDVALIARDATKLAGYAAEVGAQGGVQGRAAEGFACDLTQPDAIRGAFAEIRARLGPASVLVYNSSRWSSVASMELDPAEFAWDLALCATGALVAAQQVYPGMRAAGGGSMLFTGGGLALYPEHGARSVGLTAGKCAMRGLAIALAQELAPEGIHVGTITIAGTIQAGTAFDPDRIAEHFWRLHAQPRDAWEAEYVYRGT
jgi:NAD(P)-dependent dehydrogenase (short-subunit alcohol dehydrogenase family)